MSPPLTRPEMDDEYQIAPLDFEVFMNKQDQFHQDIKTKQTVDEIESKFKMKEMKLLSVIEEMRDK